MNKKEIERLFRVYRPGDRVVAVMDIIYGTGAEVVAGTEGTVQDAVLVEGEARREVPRGVVVVRWDTGFLQATSSGSIDRAVPLVEVELHSTERSAIDATCKTIEALPGGMFIERPDGSFLVPGGAVAWMAERQGYVRRVLPLRREPSGGTAVACSVCGKDRHEDDSPVTWRCAICGSLVCRDCTRTIPGSKPREYHALTLCSDKCWEAAGRPSD